MFGIRDKYYGPGCYKFLDDVASVIYVGSAKNIDRRLKSHFSKKGSNVDKKGYDSTARVEITKTITYGKALDFEQYLINKYKPKYNIRDKNNNINSKVVSNPEYYEDLEKWELYYKFRDYDFDKIRTTRNQDKLALIITVVFFISTLMYMMR